MRRFCCLKAVQRLLVICLHSVVHLTLIIVNFKLKFFRYLSFLIITLILSCFDKISRNVRPKKEKKNTAVPSLACLFDQLFTLCSVFFNDLAISLTEWPDDRNNAACALAQTVSFFFRERAEKMRE